MLESHICLRYSSIKDMLLQKLYIGFTRFLRDFNGQFVPDGWIV